MAKLKYWLAVQNEDSQIFNIIAKTKKECVRLISEGDASFAYEAPVKKEIVYKDGFDLFKKATIVGRSLYIEGVE